MNEWLNYNTFINAFEVNTTKKPITNIIDTYLKHYVVTNPKYSACKHNRKKHVNILLLYGLRIIVNMYDKPRQCLYKMFYKHRYDCSIPSRIAMDISAGQVHYSELTFIVETVRQ